MNYEQLLEFLKERKVASRHELRQIFENNLVNILHRDESIGIVNLTASTGGHGHGNSKYPTTKLFRASKPFTSTLLLYYIKTEPEALIDYMVGLIGKEGAVYSYKARALKIRLKKSGLDEKTATSIIQKAGHSYTIRHLRYLGLK